MTAYRYFRIYVLENNGDAQYVSMNEIELATTVGGADFTAPGMPAVASSEVNASNSADQIIDNVTTGTANSWHSALNDIVGSWIKVDVGSDQLPVELRIWPRQSPTDLGRAPKIFDLEGSHDDTNWELIRRNHMGTKWREGTTPKTFPVSQVTPAAGEYQYFRIYITDNNGDPSFTVIGEVELALETAGANILAPEFNVDSLSQNTPGTGPRQVIAGDDLLSWATASGQMYPTWWSVDVGGYYSIKEVRMWPQDDVGGPVKAPKDFNIEGSNDTTTWDVLGSFTGVTDWTQGVSKTFGLTSALPSTYGQLTTPFVPTGAGTTLEADFLYVPNGAVQQVLDGDASAFGVTISAANVLTFNLLATVTIDTIAATSGVTVIPEGFHSLTGVLDASADVDVLGSTPVPANGFQTQLHNLILTDPLDSNNDINIHNAIISETMPNDPNITNATGLIKYGDWIDLHPTQPYVPRLVGGELDGSYVAGKYESYNGDIVGQLPFPITDKSLYLNTIEIITRKSDHVNVPSEIGSYLNTIEIITQVAPH